MAVLATSGGENRGTLAHFFRDIVRTQVVIGDEAEFTEFRNNEKVGFDFTVNRRHSGSPLQSDSMAEQ